MRNLILFLFLSFIQINLASTQTSTSTQEQIFFATASAELDAAAQEKLSALIEEINKMGDYRLEVAAYTDSRGSSSYNDQLARERSKSVIDYLENQYISADQMTVSSFGERMAGNDLNSDESQQQNRRVDIIVTGWMWNGLTTIQDSLSQPLVQRFRINPLESQLLTGAKGGEFFIAESSFVDKDGNTIEGMVDIELTEAYSLGDMISLGLTTTSEEDILESGGMFNINAKNEAGAVYLREGATIPVSVPTANLRQEMSLFYSSDHSDGTSTNIDWEDTETPITSAMPPLRIAPAPAPPQKGFFLIKYLYVDTSRVDELIGMDKPNPAVIVKPRAPRVPNYDKIVYRPYGLKKILTSEAAKNKRTEEMRTARRESYDRKVVRYEKRQVEYQESMVRYKADRELYDAKKAAMINAYNMLVAGTDIYDLQYAKALEAYQAEHAIYQRDSTRYEKYRNRKLALYEEQIEAMGGINKGTVQRYFLEVNQLGWANIDRFLKTVSTTMLAAQESENVTDRSAMVFLLIPDRNIILRMNYRGEEGFNLRRVPLGETAKIVAVKVKDQKAYISNQKMVITENMTVELDFQVGRLKDIREALASL